MYKGFAVSIVFIFLLSSGAFADIGQAQLFDIDTTNVGLLTGPATGGAASVKLLPIANSQEAKYGSGNFRTVQVGIGSLFQGATTSGLAGIYGFDQGASAEGNQWQTLTGFLDLGSQGQDLDADLWQDVFGIGRLGTAAALQSFVGRGLQVAKTPIGVKVDVLYVGVGQFDSVGAGSNNSVASGGLSIDRTIW